MRRAVMLVMRMLVGLVTGAWDVTKPGGTDYTNTVDDTIRADKAVLLSAIGAEHDFTAPTTTGVHAEGSARAWVDVAANEALRDSSEGRLFIETDTNTLRYGNAASAWTVLAPRRNIVKESLTPGGGVNYSNTAWANIANVTKAITLVGGRLLISCTITVKETVAAHTGYLRLAVDGVGVSAGDAAGVMVEYTGVAQSFTLTRLVEDGDNGIDLAAGSHTVTVQWKVSAGGTMELTNGMNTSLQLEEV
jgi:hypothetical protein